jgi:salicylate hydroxylase
LIKALIAGGGIGGIAAALCLLDAGVEVELYERAAVLTEVGAGIQISPNGVKVLQRLGLQPALDRIAFRPRALEMRIGVSGTGLFAIPMRDVAEHRFGAPYYHVHRADLIALLSDALRQRAPRAVQLNKDLTGFERAGRGIHATFADDTSAAGDMLIGADGIHSRVREGLFGPQKPRFTGNVAWRVVVPATARLKDLVPPTACIWVGPGRHAVTYYLRGGDLVNFVGVVERDDWRNESWTERGDKSELAADYLGWAKPIEAIIAEAADCYRWALFDRDPLPKWSDGNVTLLGDACHPMLPFLAQGAVMAIEDAWVLSRKLKNTANVTDALVAYEMERKPRTTRTQHGARRQMGLYHKRGWASQVATYGPMWLAAHLAPSLVHTRNDWLYNHDVTAAT